MMYEEKNFGFKTRRRITVLKAQEGDATDICKLYLNHTTEKQVKEWRETIKEAEDDFYQDVTYLIRDKCNKPIGTIETKSDDGINIEILIWIPSKFKVKDYLQELVDAMIEWCKDYEEYQMITKIGLIEAITPLGARLRILEKDVALSAS